MSADDVEVHSFAAVPLRATGQLPGHRYLPRATSIIVSRPDPELVLRTIERYGVTNYFAPPTVWISLLRSPVFDQVNLSSLRKGLLRRRRCPWRSWPKCGSACRICGLWNSTDRPRW